MTRLLPLRLRWAGRAALVRVAAAAAAVLVFAGCGAFYQAPEVRIADVRVVGLGLTGGTAEIEVEVDNPNRFALEVRRLEYVLEVSGREADARWDTLAAGISADTVRVARRSSERVTLRVPFRYQALGVAFRTWMDGGTIPYRVEGEVRASGPGGERDLPFRSRGDFSP